jgi:hypothetical protein
LKLAKSPQIKLDKDPFLTNMNMVEFDGKKVLVQPSKAEPTKGKEVVIGEERPPRMIKPKSLKDGQWQKNEGGKPQRCPKATFGILKAKYKEAGPASGGVKLDHPEYQTGQFSFLELGQHICSRELIRQTILDSAVSKFRKSGSTSARLSSNALLTSRATNAWAMGAFVDHVPALSSLGGVVRTTGATATDALPPGMVRTY